jgi:hypothetical protein
VLYIAQLYSICCFIHATFYIYILFSSPKSGMFHLVKQWGLGGHGIFHVVQHGMCRVLNTVKKLLLEFPYFLLSEKSDSESGPLSIHTHKPYKHIVQHGYHLLTGAGCSTLTYKEASPRVCIYFVMFRPMKQLWPGGCGICNIVQHGILPLDWCWVLNIF